MKPKFIATKRALADALGVSRPTLNRYEAMTGFPKRSSRGWNLAACEKFIGSRASRYELTRGTARALRDQKLSEEIRRLRIHNDGKEAELVSLAKLKTAIDATMADAEKMTEAKLCAEWPQGVAAMDTAQARVYGRRIKDIVMADLRGLSVHWEF